MNIEFKKYKLEDIGTSSKAFDTDLDGHGHLELVDMYGFLFHESAEEKPLWFMRHANPEFTRFAGIFEPGDGYLSLQKQRHMMDLAQRYTGINPYRQIDDRCWGMDCEYPFFEYRFYEDHVTYKEADILDLYGIPFERDLFKHVDESINVSHITIPCEFKGTYEGKEVFGMGNFELMYVPAYEKREMNDFFSYICTTGFGIREDGRKEYYLTSMNLNGTASGTYWIDGEEPIISTDVWMDCLWEKLPYMDDDTCIYKDTIIHIGNKEIHFEGKWGHKGLTPWPRVELSGQSQVLGTFYEGKIPYKHRNYMTFHENMDVYAHKLIKGGFKVK